MAKTMPASGVLNAAASGTCKDQPSCLRHPAPARSLQHHRGPDLRDMLEDLGGDLGVTYPVSGTVVADIRT